MQIKVSKAMSRPSLGHKTDAGIDIPLSKSIVIAPFTCECIELPLSQLNLKRNTCGITFIRSKYADKGLVVQSTVIDAGYTGPVHIWVYNVSKDYIKLDGGVAYIQIVCFKIKEWKRIAGERVRIKSSSPRGEYRDTTR